MRKLVLLVVILIMGVAFAGCQQAGLTEEEARSIVREEVTNQLAAEQLKGIVEQEVTKQLASIDSLVRQEVASQMAGIKVIDIIGQEVTAQLTNMDDIVVQQVNRQLSNIDELTLSKLYIKDNGKLFAYLGPDQYGNKPILGLYVGERVAVELGSSVHGDGFIFLFDGDDSGQAFIGEVAAGFGMYFHNRFGEQIFALDTDSEGNGSLRVHNKYGEVAFVAP